MNAFNRSRDLCAPLVLMLALTVVPASAAKKPGGGSGGSVTCDSVVGPPAFAYSVRSGRSATPQIYVADASGACTRLIFQLDTGAYYPYPHSVFFRMLPVDNDGRAVGRLATYDQIKGLVLAEFTVDLVNPGMQVSSIKTYQLRGPAFAPTWPARTALSPDGHRLAYVEAEIVNALIDLDVFVYDIDQALSSGSAYQPDVAYSATLDGQELSTPRWSTDGSAIYLEWFKNGSAINPSIARLSLRPEDFGTLQNLIDPSGVRLALFDVHDDGTGNDVIVYGETPADAPYCYGLRTATCSSGGACSSTAHDLTVAFFTSAEASASATSILTQPVSRRDCVPGASVIRAQIGADGTAMSEPLLSKAEWPSSAD